MTSIQTEIDTLVHLAFSLRQVQIKIQALEERDKRLTKALLIISEMGGASPGDKKHEIARAALSE